MGLSDATETSVEFWRNQALSLESQYEESQKLFEELTQCSKEIERDLEIEIEAKVKEVESLKRRESVLVQELELKTRSEQEQSIRILSLQREVQQIKSQIEKLTAAHRVLEQSNDDYERRDRENLAIISDLGSKYDDAVEKLIMAKEELEEERSESAEKIQRLKDELRDVRSELAAVQSKQVISEMKAQQENGLNESESPTANGVGGTRQSAVYPDFMSPQKGGLRAGRTNSTSSILSKIPSSPVTPVFKRAKIPQPTPSLIQSDAADDEPNDLLSGISFEKTRTQLAQLRVACRLLKEMSQTTS
eukprot:TRINITY_DN780_c0_g1_i1.p1 TRINITY_DN780_c0_g1~~TRINITY_DN780_c0_g1_i1.p1  ORF type:complete len:305 (+),score=77.89 TRINITY_DN780_c0_g1_i1:48-962(+)